MEQTIREIILKELPALITQDPQIRDWVWHLIHEQALPRAEAESRFERMLAELQRMREEFQAEMRAMREEFQAEMRAMREEFQAEMRAMREEQERRWEEDARRWEENNRRWEEDARRWEENNRRWEENARRWEENDRQIREIMDEIRRLDRRGNELMEEIRRLDRRGDELMEEIIRLRKQNEEMLKEIKRLDDSDKRLARTLGAIGARWGLQAETAFRDALQSILEHTFHVTVERVEYLDESGEVFGRPDTVELDVIIRDGEVLACEIKSSVSRGDVYLFERKVRSYEKRTGRKVDRAILIVPFILKKDRDLALSLGLEVYGDAEEVPAQRPETPTEAE